MNKELIKKQLKLKEKRLYCEHNEKEACKECMNNIIGNVTGVFGNVSEINGDVSNIIGNVEDIIEVLKENDEE